jgi:hypothetical protein
MTQLKDGTVLLTVGTKRGMFNFVSDDRHSWKLLNRPPKMQASDIFNGILDQRRGARMWALENQGFFGSWLRYSDDFGETWSEPSKGVAFPSDSGRKIENLWIVQPGRDSQPDVLYCGAAPASLWISEDGGDTWNLNEALENHRSREQWSPGFGGLCLHSVVTDYSDPNRMWVGISAVGCLRSDDNGKSWTFMNKNVRADFNPPENRYPEFGQCIHRFVQHPTNPEILYQQNHCGIYKSLNRGVDWIDIRNGLPSDFGFPIAVDRHNPETIFVIVEAFEMANIVGRENFPGQFTVYRSQDAGESWETMTKGLPSGPHVGIGVLRHGMCTDGMEECGVYVGSNSGQLFGSADRGENWELIADFMPPIYSVNAAVIGRG